MNGLSMNGTLEARRKAGDEPDKETLFCPCCGSHLATVGYSHVLSSENGTRPLRAATLHRNIVKNATTGEYVMPARLKPYTQTREGKKHRAGLEHQFKEAEITGDLKAKRDAWEKLRVLKNTGARRHLNGITMTSDNLKPVRCQCGRLIEISLRPQS